jgi:hypothetical protein
MQYLLVHLPWEAKVGGPIQFRWMYSQERESKKLRATVRNKARVEGCIVEAFACKEEEVEEAGEEEVDGGQQHNYKFLFLVNFYSQLD